MPADRDAFGYREDERIVEPVSMRCAEAKRQDTLEPLVVLYVRTGSVEDQIGYIMSPDNADAVAAELVRWAARARERHFQR